MQVIKVKFFNSDALEEGGVNNFGSKDYDYFYVGDEVKMKDKLFAVVSVSGVLKIVKVVGIQKTSVKANKHAIVVFDLEAAQARVQKARDIADLKQAIFNRADEARERQQLLVLAEKDEGLAAMLKELDELEKSA